MRERVRLGVLLLLIGLVWSGSSLKVPNPQTNHQDALDKEIDVTHWNGLDYEYGMFDHSLDEPVQPKKNVTQEKVPVISNNDTNNQTANKTHYNWWESDSAEYYDDWGVESYEDDDYSNHDQHEHHDKITIGNDDVAKVAPTKAVPEKKSEVKPAPLPRAEPLKHDFNPVPLQYEDDSEKNVDYWKEDEGDSDDGENDEPQPPVLTLPSDNDIDSDKYFNPDRFQDQINLHHLEDHLLQVWTVQYDVTKLPCIMLRGDIRLIVPVNPTWFNREFVEIDVPQNAEASGTCQSLNNDYQEIRLKWNVSIPEKGRVYENSVYFAFATNWTSDFSDLQIPADKYALRAITVSYYNGEIGNGDDGLVSYSVNDLAEYMTPLNQSMSCLQANQQLLIGSMQLTLSNMQMEAFRPNDETLTVGEFSRSVMCTADEAYVFDAVMTYIIWFWIGALLMVLLVFAVLLALGYRRRRCQEGQGGFGYKILSV